MRKTNLLKIVIVCILAIMTVTAFTACFSNGGVDLSAKVYFTVDGEVYARVTADGYESAKLPTDPVKPGYVFDGWYTDENVWEKQFTDSDVQNATELKITVYAKWKECTHEYGEWAETIKPACTENGQETRTCKICTLEETREVEALGHDVHSHDGKAATCEEEGYGEYEYCTRCDYSTKVTVAALGHDYGEAVYTWSNDNGSVTATMTCKNDASHVIEETVKTVKKVTQTKTCENAELSTYTATFKNKAFTAQVKENVVTADKKGHNYISYTLAPTCETEGYTAYKCTHCGDTYNSDVKPALNHNYNAPEYTWSKDYGKVTATMTCKNDPSHVIKETVKTNVTVTPATCENAELSTYTATFENEAFETQTKKDVVTASALNHNYGAPVYVWADDNKTVTATKTCKNDPSHVITEKANTDGGKVTQEKGCETDEMTTYTATFKNTAFATQVKTVKTADKTGHSYDKDSIKYEWSTDYTSVTATKTCENNEGHVIRETATSVKIVTQTLTCEKDETATFVARFNNEAFETQTKIDVVTKKATGHEYGEVTYTWSNDYGKVTAARACQVTGCTHAETETVQTDGGKVTTKLSCETDEMTTYTTTSFENTAFAIQEKTVKTADKTGHDYDITYKLSEDKKSATATATCKNNEAHVITETVYEEDFIKVVTQQKTCGQDELSSYIVSFENQVFSQYEFKGVVTATGGEHSYGNIVYVWADDNKTVTAQRTCANCNTTDTIETTTNVKVKEEQTANCMQDGYVLYEAIFQDTNLADTKKVITGTKSGHDYDVTYTPNYDKDGVLTSVEATAECKYNEAHKETETVLVTDKQFQKAVTQAATCDEENAKSELSTIIVKFASPVLGTYTQANVKTANAKDHIWYKELNDTWCTVCDYCTFTKQLTFGYDDENDCYTVTGLTSYDLTKVIIPAHYCGKPVVGIADEAFSGKFNLETVTFLDSANGYLTSIGDSAFNECEALTSIVIPEKVTSIGDSAFNECEALTSIVIPEKVTSIGDSAFSGCTKLSAITLPGGVKTIGAYAFNECEALTSIVIPDGVTSIGNSAFSSCDKLETVTFGEGSELTSIGSNAFYYCNSLTSIVIPNNVTSIGWEAFAWCKKLTSIVIPNGITSIDGYTFAWCEKLTSIVIPDSVTSIGNGAFNSCNSLMSVTLGTGIGYNSIEYNAFSGCRSLIEIVNNSQIPTATLENYEGQDQPWPYGNIAQYAQSIHSGESLLTVSGNYIAISVVNEADSTKNYDKLIKYTGDSSVTELTLPDKFKYDTYVIGDSVFQSKSLITKVTIPASVTAIGDYAFQSCSGLTSVTFETGSKLTKIGNYAFNNCDNLTSIAIPASVTEIGTQAFYYCSKLETVTFGENSKLKTIGSSAFYNCTSLTSIAIPASVTKIDSNAFEACGALTSVTFGENSGLKTIDENAFASCPFTTIEIPASVTTIGTQAFSGCDKLASVTFGSGSLLETIGNYAFNGCKALTSVVIPDNATSIGNGAFQYSGNLASVTFGENSKLDTIGGYAFYNCSALTAIVIPDNVTTIGSCAFYNCSKVMSVTLGKNIKEGGIGSSAFFGLSSIKEVVNKSDYIDVSDLENDYKYNSAVGFGRLMQYNPTVVTESALKQVGDFVAWCGADGDKIIGYTGKGGAVTLPDYLSTEGKTYTIAEKVFQNNTTITSLVIPKGVTEIGNYAFSGCTGLTSLTFADDSGLTTIGDYAFSGCEALTSLVIPDKVTTIGERAFANCSSLMSVTFRNDIGNIYFGYYSLYNASIIEVVTKTDADATTLGSYPNNYGGVAKEAKTIHSGESRLIIQGDYVAITEGDAASGYYDVLLAYLGTATELTLPDKFKYDTYVIGDSVFQSKSLITKVTIPASVTAIGDYAFQSCSGLTSVTFETGSKLTTIGTQAFISCTSLTSIVIPKGVTSIGDRAFSTCNKLETVTFAADSELTDFGEYAFANCSKLKSVVIPDKITYIHNRAFQSCTSLMSVTLGKNVTSFGSGVFEECYKLFEVVNNSDNITNDRLEGLKGKTWSSECGCICHYAKTIHSGVSTLIIKGDYAAVTEGDAVNGYYDVLIAYLGSDRELTLPDKFTSDAYVIGDSVFQSKSLITKVTIPASVTAIGDYAFQSCSGLTSITIPASVTSIGDYAFSYCYQLQTVTFGVNSKLTTIGSYAFQGCTKLTEVVIPDSVTSIGMSAFENCASLMSVTLGEGIDKNSIGSYAFESCEKLYEVINNSSLTLTIGSYEYGCVAKNAKVIVTDGTGSKIKSSGDFVYLEGATENTLLGYSGTDTYGMLELPANIGGKNYSIAGGAFMQTQFSSITIPEGVTSIGESAFQWCSSLTSIVIPASVTSIGDYAFNYCYQLQTVTFGANSKLTTIGSYAFQGCTKLTEVVIPDSVETIYSYAFQKCTKLMTVTLGTGVKTINSQAFYECTSLYQVINNSSLTLTPGSDENGCVAKYAKVIVTDGTGSKVTTDTNGYTYLAGDTESVLLSYSGTATTLTLPSTLGGKPYAIGSKVFQNQSITSITVPEGVTSIGDYAFAGCGNLSVTFETGSNLTKIGSYAFQGCKFTSIEIPASVTSIGDMAFQNCTNLNSIDFGTNSKLETIGRNAFQNCWSLTSLSFGDNVTVGSNAFQNCWSLTSLSFGDNVTAQSYCFSDCSALTNITFGEEANLGVYLFGYWGPSNEITLTLGKNANVEMYAFQNCTNTMTVNFNGTYEEWQVCDTSWLNMLSADYTVNCTDGTVDRYGDFTANA